jgi:hypothetical protein
MCYLVMAVDRALIVDVLAPPLQDQANAWGSRMLSLGGLAGFYMYDSFSLSSLT